MRTKTNTPTKYIDFVIEVICKNFDITKAELLSYSRIVPIPMARAVLIKALRDKKISMARIGFLIGRDHATVIWFLKKHKLYMTDPRYKNAYHTVFSQNETKDIDKNLKFYNSELDRINKTIARLTQLKNNLTQTIN